MDRKNLLVKQIVMGILGVFSLSLGGCFSGQLPTPTEVDFRGEWKSDKNEILTLYADSSFVIKNHFIGDYTAKLLFFDSSETKISGKGTWRIYKNKLCLNYSSFIVNNETVEKKYGFTLSIKGSGFLENRLPWRIISWVGEDEGYSIFQKVE